MSDEDTVQLTDEESVVVLKVIRNNPFNHIKQLVFKEEKIHIVFSETIPDEVTLPKEETMAWKDKEWRKFFNEHGPLL